MNKEIKSPQERADLFRNKWLPRLKDKYEVYEVALNVFTITVDKTLYTYNSASNYLSINTNDEIESGLKYLIKTLKLND